MRAGGPRTQEALYLPLFSFGGMMGQPQGLPRRISHGWLGDNPAG